MRHIAQQAGVSLGTVSHVINGTAGVREPLRQRVLDAIQALGYQPSQLARGLRRNRSSIVGMIIPDIANPFFPATVRGVEDVAHRHGYRLVLCNADNDPEKEIEYMQELRSYRIAGLVMTPSEGSNLRQLNWLGQDDCPTVCLDRRPDDWHGDSVGIDNAEGARTVVRHLIQLGHRRIAAIAGPLTLENARLRLQGVRDALEEAGLTLAPNHLKQSRFDRLSAHEATGELLRLRTRPTAIVCANDLIALGALAAVREAGLRCPEDISITGFDDLEWAAYTAPTLTTVAQPGYELGAAAASLLMQRLNGESGPTRAVLLPSELRIRQSTAPPHAPGPSNSASSTRRLRSRA